MRGGTPRRAPARRRAASCGGREHLCGELSSRLDPALMADDHVVQAGALTHVHAVPKDARTQPRARADLAILADHRWTDDVRARSDARARADHDVALDAGRRVDR